MKAEPIYETVVEILPHGAAIIRDEFVGWDIKGGLAGKALELREKGDIAGLGFAVAAHGALATKGFVEGFTFPFRPKAWVETGAQIGGALMSVPLLFTKKGHVILGVKARRVIRGHPMGVTGITAEAAGGVAGGYLAGKVISSGLKKVGVLRGKEVTTAEKVELEGSQWTGRPGWQRGKITSGYSRQIWGERPVGYRLQLKKVSTPMRDWSPSLMTRGKWPSKWDLKAGGTTPPIQLLEKTKLEHLQIVKEPVYSVKRFMETTHLRPLTTTRTIFSTLYIPPSDYISPFTALLGATRISPLETVKPSEALKTQPGETLLSERRARVESAEDLTLRRTMRYRIRPSTRATEKAIIEEVPWVTVYPIPIQIVEETTEQRQKQKTVQLQISEPKSMKTIVPTAITRPPVKKITLKPPVTVYSTGKKKPERKGIRFESLLWGEERRYGVTTLKEMKRRAGL